MSAGGAFLRSVVSAESGSCILNALLRLLGIKYRGQVRCIEGTLNPGLNGRNIRGKYSFPKRIWYGAKTLLEKASQDVGLSLGFSFSLPLLYFKAFRKARKRTSVDREGSSTRGRSTSA
jgi:hypothetical protein